MNQAKAIVLKNEQISSDFFELTLDWSKFSQEPLPGQFLTIRVSDDTSPLLRRPFAFSSYDHKSKNISLIYQKRGRGTEILVGKRDGDQVDCIGPLGNPFPLVSSKLPVLIAGGIGLGPMLFLCKYFQEKSIEKQFIFGCRNKTFIPNLKSFSSCNPIICTDDGSQGFFGNVKEFLLSDKIPFNLEQSELFACGPTPMLKACHELSVMKNIQCYVSIEQIMACGVGACMGCAVKTPTGYTRACTEGPVFKSQELLWS